MAGITIDTKLLLHCDGSDTSTTFTDVSPALHGNATVAGDAQVDTANKKFGTGALLLDGIVDSLTYVDSTDWDVQTNFTIDLWWDPDSNIDNRDLVSQYENSSNFWVLRNFISGGSVIDFTIHSLGGDIVRCTSAGGSGIALAGGFQHLALCKVNSLYGIYIDGTQVAFVNDVSLDTFSAALFIGAGSGGSSNLVAGHIDEIRIQHSNVFGVTPNVGLNSTLEVPIVAYSAFIPKGGVGIGAPLIF